MVHRHEPCEEHVTTTPCVLYYIENSRAETPNAKNHEILIFIICKHSRIRITEFPVGKYENLYQTGLSTKLSDIWNRCYLWFLSISIFSIRREEAWFSYYFSWRSFQPCFFCRESGLLHISVWVHDYNVVIIFTHTSNADTRIQSQSISSFSTTSSLSWTSSWSVRARNCTRFVLRSVVLGLDFKYRCAKGKDFLLSRR